MKKLLMSLTLLGTFAAMSAKGDSYLYWFVNQEDGGSSTLFNYAELSAVDADGKKTWLQTTAAVQYSGAETGYGYDTVRNGQGISLSQLGDPTAYSFLVELYAGESWKSQSTLTYKAIYDAGGIYDHLAPTGAGAATFTTFSVPEPTSGLLMLFGLCGLALKRKRA